MEQAVSAAREHNPRLNAARHAAQSADYSARSLRAAPPIGLEVEPQIERDTPGPSASRFDLDVILFRPLDLAGRRRWSARALGYSSEAAAADQDETELQVIAEVQAAFLDLLARQTRLQVLDENLELVRELRRFAAERVAQGTAPQLDLLKFDVEVARAEEQRLAGAGALRVARSQLARAIGSDSAEMPVADGDLLRWRLQLDVAGLADRALATRPARRAMLARLGAAEAAIQVAASRARPDAAATVRREFGETSLGLAFSLPLLGGGEIGNDIKARRQDTEATSAQLRQVELQILGAVEQGLAEFQTIEQRLDRLDAIVASVRELSDKAQVGYQEGAFGRLEVLEAQRTLRDVLLDELDARAALAQAAVRLNAAVGLPSLDQLFVAVDPVTDCVFVSVDTRSPIKEHSDAHHAASHPASHAAGSSCLCAVGLCRTGDIPDNGSHSAVSACHCAEHHSGA